MIYTQPRRPERRRGRAPARPALPLLLFLHALLTPLAALAPPAPAPLCAAFGPACDAFLNATGCGAAQRYVGAIGGCAAGAAGSIDAGFSSGCRCNAGGGGAEQLLPE